MKCQPYQRGCSKEELALFNACLRTSSRYTRALDDSTRDLVLGIEIVPTAVRAHFLADGKTAPDKQAILARNLPEFPSLMAAMAELATGVWERVESKAAPRR